MLQTAANLDGRCSVTSPRTTVDNLVARHFAARPLVVTIFNPAMADRFLTASFYVGTCVTGSRVRPQSRSRSRGNSLSAAVIRRLTIDAVALPEARIGHLLYLEAEYRRVEVSRALQLKAFKQEIVMSPTSPVPVKLTKGSSLWLEESRTLRQGRHMPKPLPVTLMTDRETVCANHIHISAGP